MKCSNCGHDMKEVKPSTDAYFSLVAVNNKTSELTGEAYMVHFFGCEVCRKVELQLLLVEENQ